MGVAQVGRPATRGSDKLPPPQNDERHLNHHERDLEK
jgi:hypothetical protein